MIRTPIFEHFGNMHTKYSEMNYHNLGLGATARYKTGYIVKTADNNFTVLDNNGGVMSTFTSRASQDIKAVPSRGFIMSKSGVGTNTILEKIDPRTGALLGSLTFPVNVAYVSYDIYENGDILILNTAGNMIYLYDYQLQLKNSTSIIYGGNFTSEIFALTKGAKFLVANERQSKSSLYNKSNLSTIVLDNLAEDYINRTLTEEGWIRWDNGSTLARLLIQKIDFLTDTLVSSSIIDIKNNSDPAEFLNNIGENLYFFHMVRRTSTEVGLVKINPKTGAKETVYTGIPYNQSTNKPVMLDDKHLVIATTSGYNFYKMTDFTLDFTYANSYALASKRAYSTKGKYQNFGKYW